MSGTCAGSFLFGLALMASISSPAAAFNKIDLPGTRTKESHQGLMQNCQRQLPGRTGPVWLHDELRPAGADKRCLRHQLQRKDQQVLWLVACHQLTNAAEGSAKSAC